MISRGSGTCIEAAGLVPGREAGPPFLAKVAASEEEAAGPGREATRAMGRGRTDMCAPRGSRNWVMNQTMNHSYLSVFLIRNSVHAHNSWQ